MWLADQHDYDTLRRRLRAQDSPLAAYAAQLRGKAERLSGAPVPAVTDQTPTPHSPSSDLHDYVSIQTYWWPNPDTPDGLPYVLRDGEPSSELEKYGRPRWDRAADGMVTTLKAWFFLQDPAFAANAAARMRRWFIDPASRMNPHLAHAHFLPGKHTGKPGGIIDFSLHLPPLLDHLRHLSPAPAGPWTPDDQQAMASWAAALLDWLQTHPFARFVEGLLNNHSIWYDRLMATLLLFLGQADRARDRLERTRLRIAQQIEPDGSMPHELGRTCSFNYTLMNTRGFVQLAWIGRQLGVDLWNHRTDDGRCIGAAVDFLFARAATDEPWPWKQIEPIDWRMICPVLNLAGKLSGKAYPLAEVAHRMPAGFVADGFTMIEPLHPFGAERSPA